MVSIYDVFYVIAKKGEIKLVKISEALNKPKKEYQNIFNNVLELEKKGYIKRGKTIKVIHSKKSQKLFNLIEFCIHNNINYNIMFKETMIKFLEKAAKKEFFTIKNIKIHPQTFNFYITALNKYGLLLIISRKPLKCKLLRHHFLIDLVGFFSNKLKYYLPKQTNFTKEIKKELKKYKRNLKINYTAIQNLENKEEANFIYSSLNLEGNPLTLPETQKLILNKIIPEKKRLIDIEEVSNYKKAVDLMISNAKRRVKLELDLILEYHKIAMQTIHGAGKIRKQNVKIKLNPNFKTCEWQLIPKKLDNLLDEYNKFYDKKPKIISDIIEFASFFHNEFQRIHPFIDGNSRISRLLMLHILRSYGIPILDLPLGYFDLYLDLTKKSTKRDDKALKYLIEEIILMNLKGINLRTD